MDLSSIRKEYCQLSLDENRVDKWPFSQLRKWLHEANHAACMEHTAMSLATVGANGHPSVRTVLLKYITEAGLCFFTNYNSRKGLEIKTNHNVAALLFWPELERQVRVEGSIEKLPEELSDQYFQERPFDSQISAWASPQSTEIPNREVLEKRWKEEANRWQSKTVERPYFWGGYQIIPYRFEFWQGRPSRLHDRIEFQLIKNQWTINRLAP